MKLYSYWRSSCSYRVRIALNLKGVDYEYAAVNLLAKEQKAEDYMGLNAAGLVPTLVLDDGRHLQQSSAILEWLNAEYPDPPLLPGDKFERARVLGWTNIIACEVQPLNNVGVTNYIKDELGANEDQLADWFNHWFARGFDALESEIAAAPYCSGASVDMADLFLVPQVYNALRFNYDIASLHPKVYSVWQACNELQAFIDAQPENQPDAI